MDTTPKFIKMCEKAGKIQEIWHVREGDFVVCVHNGSMAKKGKAEVECASYDRFEECGKGLHIEKNSIPTWIEKQIWLPRIDQLQEMVEPSGLSDYLLYRFWDFLTEKKGEYALNSYARLFDSMEQLWLAFVMHEKYNKIWYNEKEEWVNDFV